MYTEREILEKLNTDGTGFCIWFSLYYSIFLLPIHCLFFYNAKILNCSDFPKSCLPTLWFYQDEKQRSEQDARRKVSQSRSWKSRASAITELLKCAGTTTLKTIYGWQQGKKKLIQLFHRTWDQDSSEMGNVGLVIYLAFHNVHTLF